MTKSEAPFTGCPVRSGLVGIDPVGIHVVSPSPLRQGRIVVMSP